jgi:hypothetical protein
MQRTDQKYYLMESVYHGPSTVLPLTIVWVWNALKRPFNLRLGSQLSTIGRWWTIYDLGPSGKSLITKDILKEPVGPWPLPPLYFASWP